MRREIKVGLMQEKPKSHSTNPLGASMEMSSDLKNMSYQSLVSKQDTLLRDLAQEFTFVKKRLRETETRLGVTERRLAQLMRGTKGRMDKIQSGLKATTDHLQKNGQEVTSKLSVLAGRLQEQKINDKKTNELMGRHNQVVQNLETRLRQTQKLISEQEFKILNYQATLTETRKELAILKGF